MLSQLDQLSPEPGQLQELTNGRLTRKPTKEQPSDCRRNPETSEDSKVATLLHLCLAPSLSRMGECPNGQSDALKPVLFILNLLITNDTLSAKIIFIHRLSGLNHFFLNILFYDHIFNIQYSIYIYLHILLKSLSEMSQYHYQICHNVSISKLANMFIDFVCK